MTTTVEEWPALPPAEGAGRLPRHVFDFRGLQRRVAWCAEAAKARGFTLAYSIKTNPDPQVLACMNVAGLCAEAINGAEVEAALAAGFRPDQIVLGGPGKAWPSGMVLGALLALVDDSVDAFARSIRANQGHRYLCVRLRFPGVSSRLGVDTTSHPDCRRIAEQLRQARAAGAAVGLATHQRSSSHSTADQWLTTIEALLDGVAKAADGLDGVSALDLGGGFTADGLDALLVGETGRRLRQYVRRRLPNCHAVIFEPGRSLVESYGFVLSTVIANVSAHEVIVDASLAELPWPFPEHRPVYVRRGDEWLALGKGTGIVAGRTTVETDVLASHRDVSELRTGDLICFTQAGAYDVSMRNQFGIGSILSA